MADENLVEDDEERPRITELECLLLKLGIQLSQENVRKFRFVCSGLTKSDKIKNETTLAGIVECLLQYQAEDGEKRAISFTYFVLKSLSIPLTKSIETLFKPYLIDHYTVTDNADNINCRILMLNFLYDLDEEKYKYLLDAVCFVLEVSNDRFNERWTLAEEFFNSNLISNPRQDINEFYLIADLWNCQSLFAEYYKKYNIQVPLQCAGETIIIIIIIIIINGLTN